MKKSILLTGGTGFIGKNIIKNLNSKYNIFSLERKKKNKIYNFKSYSIVGFSDPDQISKIINNINIDYIIHAATYYKKKDNDVNLKQITKSNILLGMYLLNFCSEKKVIKFINFSTCWENYNDKKENPFNLYSATKLAFKKIINYHQKINKITKFYNIYLMNTFGEDDNRIKIVSKIKKDIKNNRLTIITSNNLFLNLLNVKDIVHGIDLILSKNLRPGDYNMINNKHYAINDIISEVCKKKKIKYKYLTKKIIYEKIFNLKKVKGWKPKFSKISDIVKAIV